MATAVQGIDARSSLAGWLAALTQMTSADIKAIPEDKWTATFGGCSRPANVLLADTISMLTWTTAALKGEEPASYDQSTMATLASAISDQSEAVSALQEAAQDFSEALTSCSEETLNSTITPPWQMPTPVWMIAHIAVSHVFYHDGQFNYIQCLLGDDKIHWMGE